MVNYTLLEKNDYIMITSNTFPSVTPFHIHKKEDGDMVVAKWAMVVKIHDLKNNNNNEKHLPFHCRVAYMD